MKILGNLLGVILLVGVGLYLYGMGSQIDNVEALCEAHPPGIDFSAVQRFAEAHRLESNGPFTDTDLDGKERYIYCATLTSCAHACAIETDLQIVTSAVYSVR